MKFVHAADIHLDSPLRGLERYEGAPVDAIRRATRDAFGNLVELCRAESAELLVIAGDLYDGDWPDYNTGLFFIGQVARLTREGVKVVWLRGNHDAESRITSRLTLPDGAHGFSAKTPETIVFDELGVAVHGQSYAKRDVVDDLAAGYPAPRPGLVNIGVLHTALDGRPGHDAYAPTSIARLVSRGYDYWALGHVHQREVVNQDPWIVFPGNLQGRHARETGAKGATLVTVDEGRITAVEHRELDVVRWADCSVEAAGAETGEAVVARVREQIESASAAAGDRLLAARVRISGLTAADTTLRTDPERWRNEIRAAFLDGSVWIEKIAFDTRPTIDVDALLERDDPVSGVLRAVRAAAEDAEVLRELAADLSGMSSKLPTEYRALADAIDFANPADIAALLEGIERDLLPRLVVPSAG